MREAVEDMMKRPKLPSCPEMNAAVPASRQLPCFGAGAEGDFRLPEHLGRPPSLLKPKFPGILGVELRVTV